MTQIELLVVEDDPDLCDNLKDILEEEQIFKPRFASTCAGALEVAEQHHPQAALLDLHLPDGRGTTLLLELKKMLPDCLCVIMTAHADLDSALQSIEGGVHQFLQKPVHPSKILMILRGVRESIELRLHKQQAEAALKEERRILKNVIEATSAGTWDWNVTTGKVRINDQWAENVGYRREEIEPVYPGDWKEQIHPDDSEQFITLLEDHLAGKTEQFDAVLRFRHRDGSWVWLNARGRVIERDEHGNPVRMCGTNVDISARRRAEEERARLEEQYRRAQKVESIGRLAGGVAHDLNNLMTPIIGYSQMVMEDMDPGDQNHEAIVQIFQAGCRSRDLVRQLLAFGRRQMLQYKPLELNRVLEGIEDLLSRTIRENIKIKTEYTDQRCVISADQSQIEQVVLNIATNAAEAMPEGGTLKIETFLSRLDEKYAKANPEIEPGMYATLTLSDTGCGMDAETISHVFEPFFSTKGELGTGMGLASVYGVVKQHGGEIEVKSTPGEGSKFTIYLPLDDTSLKEQEAPSGKAAELSGAETVLLAEDNPAVRNVAAAALTRHGYTVLTAVDGNDALRVLDEHGGKVDLLFTDIVMPGRDGRELARIATERHPGLKTLLTSGYPDDELTLEQGHAFIQKPFKLNDLLKTVRETLDS